MKKNTELMDIVDFLLEQVENEMIEARENNCDFNYLVFQKIENYINLLNYKEFEELFNILEQYQSFEMENALNKFLDSYNQNSIRMSFSLLKKEMVYNTIEDYLFFQIIHNDNYKAIKNFMNEEI